MFVKSAVVIGVFCWLSLGFKQDPLRVACIGDSVTYGAFIENPDVNSYPAQLAKKLGPNFEVRNFGVKGAGILKKGDKPYLNQPAFQQALDYKPDIVIIILGTNDAQLTNWSYNADFKNDYTALINQFKQLDPAPKIYIALPLPVFKNKWNIQPNILKNEIRPIIKQVAKEAYSHLIDLNKLFNSQKIPLNDGIHPDKNGATQIADAIYHELNKKLPTIN